jgi:hypothetical protein
MAPNTTLGNCLQQSLYIERIIDVSNIWLNQVYFTKQKSFFFYVNIRRRLLCSYKLERDILEITQCIVMVSSFHLPHYRCSSYPSFWYTWSMILILNQRIHPDPDILLSANTDSHQSWFFLMIVFNKYLKFFKSLGKKKSTAFDLVWREKSTFDILYHVFFCQ